jgi:hypothetical protein
MKFWRRGSGFRGSGFTVVERGEVLQKDRLEERDQGDGGRRQGSSRREMGKVNRERTPQARGRRRERKE